MSDTMEALKDRLRVLPGPERAELARFLIDSLGPESDDDAEAAWEVELARRAAEIRSGGRQVGRPGLRRVARAIPVKPARFHPEAEAELLAAIECYEGQRPGLGGDLRQEVEAIVGLIRQRPCLFAAWPADGLRKCPVRRFPYAVCDLELDAEVWIAAVAHQKRRPGSWAGRSST